MRSRRPASYWTAKFRKGEPAERAAPARTSRVTLPRGDLRLRLASASQGVGIRYERERNENSQPSAVSAVATTSSLFGVSSVWSCRAFDERNHREDGSMSPTATCEECGQSFDDDELDEGYCETCFESLAEAGRAAMDPDGRGYGEDGVWDPERLGL